MLMIKCKLWEITHTVSRILHVFDPAVPHFTVTQTIFLPNDYEVLLVNLSLTFQLESRQFEVV